MTLAPASAARDKLWSTKLSEGKRDSRRSGNANESD